MAELTQELRTVGTPNYMSPEQIRSPHNLDLRTDIYSLGATFYHLVTGRPPFGGETPIQVIAHHLNAPLEPPIKHKPDLPAGLSSVICKMMAKSPEERYPDYEMLHEDLKNLAEGRRTNAAGFTDTFVAGQHEQELRTVLEGLTFSSELEVEDETQQREAEDEETESAGPEASPVVPFGPEDFGVYTEPEEDEALRRREHAGGLTGLIVGLVVVGVLILIAIALLTGSLSSSDSGGADATPAANALSDASGA
jgi:hypothetical protein